MSSRDQPAGNSERRAPSEPRTDPGADREGRPRGKATRYRGVADWWGRHVWVERDGIRGALSHHGEDFRASYAWGRSGIGARELARALLFDATDSAALSERYCRDFTHEVLAHLPEPAFVLGRDEILAWIAERPGETTA
jgi:uncharacterized protein DUF6166